MNTEIKFRDEARQALKEGVDEIADAVKVSMGAEGRTVVIPTPNGGYIATKDGVTIARGMMPEGNFKEIGASLVKEASTRTNSKAGDGTTTAAVLTQAIFNGGLELLDNGASAVQLKKGIDNAVKDVVKYLDDNCIEISSDNLKNVTTISVNGDEDLGELIADAFNKIGENGLVLSQVSDTKETYIEIKEGIQLDSGFIDPLFITDPVKYETVLENPFLLLNKGKIEKGDSLVKLFDAVWSKGKNNSLVIICDDIDPFVFSTIAQNVKNGAIAGKICIVKTPQILKIHKDLLEDIAVLSGAQIVSDETGVKLGASALGKLEKFVATETESFLIGDIGNLASKVAELNERIENEDNDIEKKDLQERLSRINGGVATLFIGASTDSELLEKRDRIEDGINATRAALEEGIVAGGGVALIDASYELGSDIKTDQGDDYISGYLLLLNAITAPFYQILENAGMDDAPVCAKGQGIDVTSGSMVDMIDAGIIDPKKVTRSALENAASVAGTFLTTEAVVARIKDIPTEQSAGDDYRTIVSGNNNIVDSEGVRRPNIFVRLWRKVFN
jgi:chaperonin GroEL